MTTKEELKQLIQLNNKFQDECKRVCKELARHDSSYNYYDSFIIVENHLVYCFCQNGFKPIGCNKFNLEFLTYTQEKLSESVDWIINYELEQDKRYREEQYEKDLAEYKRLANRLGL